MSTASQHVTIREAVRRALEFFRELHAADGISDIRVEGVERAEDASHWIVTVGYRPPETTDPFGSLSAQDILQSRQFTEIDVQIADGDVTGMRKVKL